MGDYRVFDIIGPRMIGPSSSHTAGAARLGAVARRMAGGAVRSARITLYGSFAKTGRGHGTDRAITGGLLGLAPDDDRIRDALELARESGVAVVIDRSDQEAVHPNTARIAVENGQGRTLELVGASIGGGRIEIQQINGMAVSFGCEYPTLLLFHRDQPGAISGVTGLLAERGINIAFMRVFRSARHQAACMVIETDTPVPLELAEEIPARENAVTEVCIL